MDTLRSAWRGLQRDRDRDRGAYERAFPQQQHQQYHQRSPAHGILSIIGLVLYTFVAVNALVILELVPSSLIPSFLSSKSSLSTSYSFSPPSSPIFSSRHEKQRPRIRRTRRRESSDASTEPATPRTLLPAGPAVTNDTSAFLTRLPLELRQEIYRYVLAGRHKQFIRLGSDDVAHPADFRFADTPYRTRDSFVAAQPWSRKSEEKAGRLLALPLVSRQVYDECIAQLYQGVVFKACRLVTVADISRALAPAGHLSHLRELELAYEFRCGLPLRRSVALVEDADWDTAWDVIARHMPGLRRLRVDLFAFDIAQLVNPDEDKLVEDPDRWRWLASMLRATHLKTGQLKLHYIKRLNDIPWERPTRQLRWYTMVVMEALERLIEANWMGKRLDPAVPPFNLPKEGSKELLSLWETCCEMQQEMGTRDMMVLKR